VNKRKRRHSNGNLTEGICTWSEENPLLRLDIRLTPWTENSGACVMAFSWQFAVCLTY